MAGNSAHRPEPPLRYPPCLRGRCTLIDAVWREVDSCLEMRVLALSCAHCMAGPTSRTFRASRTRCMSANFAMCSAGILRSALVHELLGNIQTTLSKEMSQIALFSNTSFCPVSCSVAVTAKSGLKCYSVHVWDEKIHYWTRSGMYVCIYWPCTYV